MVYLTWFYGTQSGYDVITTPQLFLEVPDDKDLLVQLVASHKTIMDKLSILKLKIPLVP